MSRIRLGLGGRGARDLPGHAALPQDGDPVGDLPGPQSSLCVIRIDRQAVLDQTLDDLEEALDLVRGQHSRGLVKDQDATIVP